MSEILSDSQKGNLVMGIVIAKELSASQQRESRNASARFAEG